MEEQVATPESPEIKIIKITNPVWVGYLADAIREFCEKVHVPTIRYETLYSYLANVVQYGGASAELWVAHVDGDFKPIAFAEWHVKGLPHIGAAEIGYIYSWNRAKVPVGLLIDQFLTFAADNRCRYYSGDLINEAVWKVFNRAASERGIKLERTGLINFIGSKG